MENAMNGKPFAYQLMNAEVKLQRALANEGTDEISGFSTEDIADFICDLPVLGNDQQLHKAKAVLMRNGLKEKAGELIY